MTVLGDYRQVTFYPLHDEHHPLGLPPTFLLSDAPRHREVSTLKPHISSCSYANVVYSAYGMWLLRTDFRELKYFDKPPRRYAILSHVWDDDEQTFQDIRQFFPAYTLDLDPLAWASPKVRGCCVYAASQGFRWVWIDSCCIDKTSSAELSEAINSMYKWYRDATVCYVYLADVPANRDPHGADSPFRSSKWFTRGFTLQELIAPVDVRFLSQEWIWIGDKVIFATLLREITEIDIGVLTFQVPLSSVSVARRMRWASRRKTTRMEDEAYCLMGIFGVNMPTIYGEGKRAFQRLQEEIMKTCPDHTLFTWGPWWKASLNTFHTLGDFWSTEDSTSYPLLAESPALFETYSSYHPKLRVSSLQQFWESMAPLSARRMAVSISFIDSRDTHSPAMQKRPSDMSISSSSVPESRDVPQFVYTSYGVRAHLPVLDLPQTSPGAPSLALALLACHVPVWEASSLVALILRREQQVIPMYTVGATFRRAHAPVSLRWVTFNAADPGWVKLAPYTWRDIYIVDPASATGSTGIPSIVPTYTPGAHHIFIPYWVMAKLEEQGLLPHITSTFAIGTESYHTIHQVPLEGILTYAFKSRDSDVMAVIQIDMAEARYVSRALLRVSAGTISSPSTLAQYTVRWLWSDLYDGVDGAQSLHDRETSIHVSLTHMARESSFANDIFLWAIADIEFNLDRQLPPTDDRESARRSNLHSSPLLGDMDATLSADTTDLSALDTHSEYAESEQEDLDQPDSRRKRRSSLGEQERYSGTLNWRQLGGPTRWVVPASRRSAHLNDSIYPARSTTHPFGGWLNNPLQLPLAERTATARPVALTPVESPPPRRAPRGPRAMNARAILHSLPPTYSDSRQAAS